MKTLDATKIISEHLRRAGYCCVLNKKNSLGLPQFHTLGVGNSVHIEIIEKL